MQDSIYCPSSYYTDTVVCLFVLQAALLNVLVRLECPTKGSLDLSANYPALTVIHSLVAYYMSEF